MATIAHATGMSVPSGKLSGRTWLKSFVLHSLALALLLLVPSGPLRRSAPPKERDVVFHEPLPPIEIPAPALAAPRLAATGLLPPQPVERPTPAGLPPDPGPARPDEPLAPGPPDLPPGPESFPVAEAQPEPKIEQRGILALRDQLAGMKTDKVVARLGADARYRVADDPGPSPMPSRSMLTTNAPGSSGGIDVSSLSLNVGDGGGGGGGGMQGVALGRATSSIASIGGGGGRGGGGRGGRGGGGGAGGVDGNGGGGGGAGGGGRGGLGNSRTDEEIQIVFDRYKASFYRLYNRELRNDPTLQGQMVLRLTIEPDGSVSMCVLQSTDMKAPALADQVVDRVRTINFGAKDGVQALTIVYPIDFLPAA